MSCSASSVNLNYESSPKVLWASGYADWKTGAWKFSLGKCNSDNSPYVLTCNTSHLATADVICNIDNSPCVLACNHLAAIDVVGDAI